MNLHEYQAKDLLIKYGLRVQKGILVTSPDDAAKAFESIGTRSAVIKAQVHAGGRGKAGGVKVVKSVADAVAVARELIGKRLITYQTDAHGQPVNSVLISEDVYPVLQELYLGAVIDRSTKSIAFIASTEGGVEIEKVAEETPQKLFKILVDPLIGLQPFQIREMATNLQLKHEQFSQFNTIMLGIYKAFLENDFSMIEINPLSIRENGELICVDAKIDIDSNALFRQKQLAQSFDSSQVDPKELHAIKYELNYVSLEGNIGCMVNGAGLAMATMDIIKLYGGQPANFLDVGGGATKSRVIEALKIILEDINVKAILINIFGGIVRCDMIAEAIIAAVKEVKVDVPVVVRLEGNNAELGIETLNQTDFKIIPANGLDDAAQKVVASLNTL